MHVLWPLGAGDNSTESKWFIRRKSPEHEHKTIQLFGIRFHGMHIGLVSPGVCNKLVENCRFDLFLCACKMRCTRTTHTPLFMNMNMMSSVVCRVCFGWNRKLQAYQMLFSEICTKYVRSDIFVDSFIIILAHLNYSLVRLRTVCVRVCVYRCHVAGALWATAKANRTQW